MADQTPERIKVLLAIPVYNHGRTLRRVVERALSAGAEVLVVDDGSTDEGLHSLSDLKVRTVRHERNLGKGAAILTAVREAAKVGASHIITVDADGQHDPAEYRRFLPLIEESPLSVIVGKRVFEEKKTPFLSRFGRGFSNFWFRVQTGQVLQDTQSGFRAYPVELLLWLELRCRRYAFEVEVLVKAAWAGVEMKETEISVHYPPKKERVSHFRMIRDNGSISLLNTFLTIRAVLPFPHRAFRPAKGGAERISLFHPVRSIRILLGREVTPRQLAWSAALGVLVGSLPLVGLWTLTALVAAGFFRLHKLTALSASQISNIPLLPALCIEVGHFLRKGRFLTEFSLQTLGVQAPQRIWEWLLGSLMVGPFLGFLTGATVYGLIRMVKNAEEHG